MTTEHVHIPRRASYRWRYVAFALAVFPLIAGAVNRNNIGRVGQTANGRSVSIGAPTTNSGGSTIPVSPNIGGWTQAGNYGVPVGATGSTMNRVSGGETVISGQRYPFQAGYQQPKSQWVMPALGAAAAIGCTFVTGGVATVACLGLPVAMPYLYDWITRSGGRLNPETGQLERQQAGECSADCYFWRISTVVGQSQPPEQYYYRSETSACEAAGEIARGLSPRYQPPYTYPAGSGFCRAMLDGTTPTNFATLGRGSPRPADQSTWLPSSMDDIAPYMRNVNPDGRVWGEALERGAEFPQPDPTVTGPSQIQGPEKTTNNPDGSRTVERTTYNFQTSGNTITNTSNTTSSTTYNIDNSVRNSSSSTTAPTAEQADPEDPCEKRPNSIGCQELDEPPQSEIPKQERQITYAPESVLGGGSCPASRPLAYGREFSYAATCDALTTYVRPMVIAIAGWIAIVIIFGVGKPE